MSSNTKASVKTRESKTGKTGNSSSQANKTNFSPLINSPIDQISFLQRTVGNREVERLLKSGVIQAELTIGRPVAKPVFQPQTAAPPTAPVIQTKLKVVEPGDEFEEKTDRVADLTGNGNGSILPSAVARNRSPVESLQRLYGNQAVLQMRNGSGGPPAPSAPLRPSQSGILQRKCACGGAAGMSGECEECRKKGKGMLQRAFLSSRGRETETEGEVPPIVHEVLRSPGQPLEPATRAFMESRFGHDFSRVRVHTNSLAARSAEAVAAHAYTVGSDLVFASGRYAPGRRDGQRLLAHELAHVVQQDEARAVDPLTIQDASDPAERAADFAAESLSRGEPVASSLGSDSPVLQRQSATGHSTAGPPGVAAEKYSEPLEKAYRGVGQMYRADAIQRCRLYGIELCLMILTEGEARAAYKLAKEGYSPREAALLKAGPQPSVQRLARNPDGAATAALPFPVVVGGGAAITAGLEAAGAFVLAALPPLAIAAVALLFAGEVVEEIRFSRFVRILEENGFITLLNPLGACIGLCHAASTARATPRTIPWELTRPIPWPEKFAWPEKFIEGTEPVAPTRPPPRLPWPTPPPPAQEWIEPPTRIPTPRATPKLGEPVDPFPVPTEPDEPRRRRRKRCSPTGLSPTDEDAIPMVWYKPEIDNFYPATIELQGHSYRRDVPTHLPRGEPIGVPRTYWPRIGKPFQLIPEPRGRTAGEFREILRGYGFNWEGLQADHVQDLQWSGPDDFRNLWPLDMRQNPSAGTRQNNSQVVGVCASSAGPYIMRSILDIKRAGGYYGRWFKIARVES
jgi:hypothetical protein